MDNNLFDKISNWINDSEYTKKCDMDYEFAEKKYIFKPLKNINKKDESEERKGFLVYSAKKITKKDWFKSESQKRNQSKNGTANNVTLKDLEDDSEHYTCRYYYFEQLNNKKNKHITIIMINPAFAYSKKIDRTINNIRMNLNKLNKTNTIKISSFDIVNISPIRNPYIDSFVNLENFSEKYYDRKIYENFLEEVLKSAHVVLPAWGNAIDKKELNLKGKKYKEQIDKLLNDKIIAKKVCILAKTVDGNPMHLSRVNNGKLVWTKIIDVLKQ